MPARRIALVLAPVGRDASIICAMLEEEGIDARRQATLLDLTGNLDQAACAVIAEEALIHEDRGGLAGWIANQPPWSDFPFVLLSLRTRQSKTPLADLVALLGNVTVIERPLAATSLKSTVRAALRARLRQREAEHYLRELQHLTETLEARITERTHELSEANRRLVTEIEERERTEAALRQAQKMEAIGQLTGGIAHDFNNLLMAIIGNLEMLSANVEGERFQRYVRNAMHGARRGERLVKQLLAFSRKQHLAPAPVDINEIVSVVSEILERTIGPGIRIDTVTTKGLWPALADATQLELMLLNLAFNARDAMPDGGTITIETANLAQVPDQLVSELSAGQYVTVTVRDAGTGMPPEVLARAFDPFFTTKPPGKGTGLGLSQVHGFASQSGGTVRIESKLGEGTAVRLYLPRSAAAAAAAAESADVKGASLSKRETILVVDDDLAVLETASGMLDHLGYEVRLAQNAETALATFAHESIDLALIDLAMPGCSGIELVGRLHEHKQDLPILFCSGYPDLITANRERLNGEAFLNKPYTSRELATKIESLLGKTASTMSL